MSQQMLLGLAIVSAFLLPLLAFLWMRRPVVATIEGFSWERKVFFESYVWVKESSYQGFPDGSRNQQTVVETYSEPIWRIQSRIESDYHANESGVYIDARIVDENVLEGFVEKKRTKYTYEIQKWVPGERLARGRDRTLVYWPSSILNKETPENVFHTQEFYWVSFRTKKRDTYSLELAESDWKALDEKASYKLRLTLSGIARQHVVPRRI